MWVNLMLVQHHLIINPELVPAQLLLDRRSFATSTKHAFQGFVLNLVEQFLPLNSPARSTTTVVLLRLALGGIV